MLASVATAHPLRQRPFGTGVVLRLHGAERSDDINRVLETARREQLVRQAALGHSGQIVDRPHGFVFLPSNVWMPVRYFVLPDNREIERRVSPTRRSARR
jgi:hypothetical protein